MTVKEKKVFIHDLIKSVEHSILEKVDEMPENWDGIELRVYIADKYKEIKFGTMDKKRLKNYQNDLIINNL